MEKNGLHIDLVLYKFQLSRTQKKFKIMVVWGFLNIDSFIDTQKLSSRDGQIGRFQRFERIFKVLN